MLDLPTPAADSIAGEDYSLFTLSSHDQKRGQLWLCGTHPEAIKVI